MRSMHGTRRLRTGAPGTAAAAARLPPVAVGNWQGLAEEVLVLIVSHLDPEDLAAAHLVSRSYRAAVQLSTRALTFHDIAPDTARLKQVRHACMHPWYCIPWQAYIFTTLDSTFATMCQSQYA